MPAQVLVLSRDDRDTASLRTVMLTLLRKIVRRQPARLLRWTTDPSSIERRDPVVVVFFGAAAGPTAATADRLARWAVKERLFLLPIVPAGANVADALPAILSGYVAYERVTGWEEAAANRLLEELGWVPGRPRVFISYRHADGRKVADQLERVLRLDGERVVLDYRDIAGGAVLNEVLFREVAASDLVVQLCTPRAAAGDWVAFERWAAHRTSAGFYALLWPGQVVADSVSEPERLTARHFENGDPRRVLTRSALRYIVARIAEERLRAVALRMGRLERGMLTAARAEGWPSHWDSEGPGVIVQREHRGETRDERWLPLVGVPDALTLRRTQRFERPPERLRPVFDQRVLHPNDDHLDWLAKHLPVHLTRLNQVRDADPDQPAGGVR